jgi:glycosyltransferase involved in cell wall biosynthesis
MDSMSQPLVSVITPVYNGAEYLAGCIESVLAQTYQNWDYTIVNNCSTDESLEIAQKYASQNPRIRIHNNSQFLRVIPNHNHALRQISPASKYCKVVFADDWIYPECIERMVGLAEKNPSVGIVGAYGLQGHEVAWAGLEYPGNWNGSEYPSTIVTGRELARRRFLGPQTYARARLYVFGTATSVLFRSDIVRSQPSFYNEANLHADSEKSHEILKRYDFGFVHQVLTFNRVRPGSLTSFSKRMNTNIAGFLHDVVTFGPDYLNKEELDFAVKRVLCEYYEFLAGEFLFGWRDKEFWTYHKRKMNEAGVGFSRTSLARAVLAKFVNNALNPKNAVEKLFSLLSELALNPTKEASATRPERSVKSSGTDQVALASVIPARAGTVENGQPVPSALNSRSND